MLVSASLLRPPPGLFTFVTASVQFHVWEISQSQGLHLHGTTKTNIATSAGSDLALLSVSMSVGS
jgi:hypothetical protein